MTDDMIDGMTGGMMDGTLMSHPDGILMPHWGRTDADGGVARFRGDVRHPDHPTAGSLLLPDPGGYPGSFPSQVPASMTLPA